MGLNNQHVYKGRGKEKEARHHRAGERTTEMTGTWEETRQRACENSPPQSLRLQGAEERVGGEETLWRLEGYKRRQRTRARG